MNPTTVAPTLYRSTTPVPNSASSSAGSEDGGIPLDAVIGVVLAVLLIACVVLAVFKKRSAGKVPGIAYDPNATSAENAVFAPPGDGPSNGSDYHIPDFGEGTDSTKTLASQPDYDEVQSVPSEADGAVGPDSEHTSGFGAGAEPAYADASGLVPQATTVTTTVATAGDYDQVNFEGAARFNGLPPNAISAAPTYDKQTPSNAPRPASLYDIMADGGSDAAPRPVQIIRGNAAQALLERANGATEVCGNDANSTDALYEQMTANSTSTRTAAPSQSRGAGAWQVGGGYDSDDDNATSPDSATLGNGTNIAHDYEALQDRSVGTTNYEVLQGGGGVDVLYSTTASNGDIAFAAKQSAPGNIVYAASPTGTDENTTFEATVGLVTTAARGGATPNDVPDYVHSTVVDRKKAETALRDHRLSTGCHILRTKKPGTYVMTMCTDAANGTFAHHVLQCGTGGVYMINDKPLSKPCATLSAAVDYLKTGAPNKPRHPDIRIRPAGAPVQLNQVPEEMRSRKGSVYNGFDDSHVAAPEQTYAAKKTKHRTKKKGGAKRTGTVMIYKDEPSPALKEPPPASTEPADDASDHQDAVLNGALYESTAQQQSAVQPQTLYSATPAQQGK